MNFLITSFFKEMDEPLTLLKSRGLVLDNPRTAVEIDHITMLLTRATSMEGVHTPMLPGIAVHSSWPDGLDAVRNRTLAAVVDDQIPADHGLDLMEEVASAAAPQLVLCRFDDEGEFDALSKLRDTLAPHTFLLLDDDNPLIARSREAFEIGHLLAIRSDPQSCRRIRVSHQDSVRRSRSAQDAAARYALPHRRGGSTDRRGNAGAIWNSRLHARLRRTPLGRSVCPTPRTMRIAPIASPCG